VTARHPGAGLICRVLAVLTVPTLYALATNLSQIGA
jgi:hypothetical protein